MTRYELQQPVHRGVIRAWDRVFLRTVALKKLPEGLSAVGSGAPLLEMWERWFQAPHPGLLQPVRLDFQANHLLREWVEGFSLLDLVRKRHRLTAVEAFSLLSAAAPTLDHAAGYGLHGQAGLDKWLVAFVATDADAAGALSQPLTGWPAWRLRLDPLRLAALVAVADDRTVHRLEGELDGVAPSVLAGYDFLRELLGGSMLRRGSPLATLNDEGNRLLAGALKAARFPSATALATALAATLPEALSLPAPELAPPVHEFPLLDSPGSMEDAGETLSLEPMSAVARALALVQRDEFVLGRSTRQADFALRFGAPNGDDSDQTTGLSRVHVRFRRQGAALRIFDGSETTPSSNGTFTREGTLPHGQPLPLDQVRMLQLGNHWRATVIPVHAPKETVVWSGDLTHAPTLAQEGAPTGGPGWGAVYIAPAKGCAARVDTVWLLEEAGFGLDAETGLAWDTEGLGTAPGGFRARAGQFYLLNRRLDQVELTVDRRRIAPGTAALLRDGMVLKAGRDEWRIHVA